MTKIKNSFDSKEELKQLNIKRLFTSQKLLLKDMEYYINNSCDRNELYNCLQNIYAINIIINKKINGK